MEHSDITTELSQNFINYAAAVNQDRSIPDARSGLKPVARRILYDMYATGTLSNKPHVKCAKIVGDTMGRFHPHGDSSIYGALVRLAQPWVMRYPLIDFHGNRGNIGGDSAASMRYTEARLSKLSEIGMLEGLKKKVVDFQPNYSEDEEEPVTLISLFPNLLCNPNSGIGVAMATNWLPHNLTEVGNGILAYLENQEITIEELVAHIPGPDFPLGGKIINKKDMLSCYKTGRGRVIVQARYDLETRAGKQLIVFKELPFGVNSEALLEEIDKLYTKGEITGIQAVRDESNKKGLRVVIELVKGGDVSSIVNKLYKHTKLQSNENFNQVALVDKVPTLLNLKQVIEIYVNHQIDIIVKEIQFDLTKAKVRLNIVEGLLIALEDIDNVISLIKASSSAADARIQLAKKYKLNEDQAKAIVEMKLGRIAGLEKIEIQEEKEKLLLDIEDWEDVLKNEWRQKAILNYRLSSFIKKYGDDRRTEITNVEMTKEEKAAKIIEPEDVVVILTKGGHIKRVPTKNFRIQKRNGKGSKNKDDSILDIIKTNTVDTLVMFSSKGKIYRILVDDVPEGENANKGVLIGTVLKMVPGEEIIAITSLYRDTQATSAVFVTAQGHIKKTALEEYTKGGKSFAGLLGIKLKEGDKVVDITFLKDQELILISKGGMCIRVKTADIGNVGRLAIGVKGMKLNEGDEVVAAVPVHKDSDYLAIFTKSGLAKKVPLKEFTTQGRNGKGVIVYKNELVAGAAMVDDLDNILIIGNASNITISSKDIPVGSRVAAGNIMIKGNLVSSIVKI